MTITRRAFFINGYTSDTPEGHELSVVTIQNNAGETEVYHTYTLVKATTSPIDADIERRIALIMDAHFIPLLPTGTMSLPNGKGHREGRFWVADFCEGKVVEVTEIDFMRAVRADAVRSALRGAK